MVQGINELFLVVFFKYIFFCYTINRAAGDVELAFDTKTNTNIAIKRMLWSKQPRKELIVSEIRVMRNCRFRSIVNFLDCYLRPNELWSMYSIKKFEFLLLIHLCSCHGIYEWWSIDTNC